ncbi:MAG: hypothetical protein KME03_09660 [Aphanocapsa lilacina HA4352-LM1]|nr:hypothetical protein [Aphanocapsa lilacina HA4352-LM1]
MLSRKVPQVAYVTIREIQYTLKVLEGAYPSDKLLIKAKALSGRLISPAPAVQ